MRRAVLAVSVALLSVSLTAPALAKKAAPTPAVQKVTFTNKEVDGKKVWLPAEASLKFQGKVEITLINELKDPHGFSAPGLTKEPIVVLGGETKTVEVDGKKGEYKFVCQLHPAHVGGTIKID